ncbi:MAG: hypothetical protein IJS78_06310 [Clostridia bacterium]|nr:hypothetical protein [Clostridia bacterium]
MKLNGLFRDGAVIAADEPLYVFGTGDGHVRVEFLGRAAEADSEDGEWIVTLPPTEPGGPFTMDVIFPDERVTVRDLYAGRVYLVAGQSNAEFRLSESNTPPDEYEDDPLLRNYFVDRPWGEGDPLSSENGWYRAKADEVGDWTAIGYLTGRRIRRAVGGAVGIVSCYQGASVIEAWLPEKDAKEFRLSDEDLYEDHTLDLFASFNQDGKIYREMLSGVSKFSFTGVVWYQGESDSTVPEANIYDRELARFIETVRRDGKNDRLPFAVVQIADADYRKTFDPDGWIGIQKAQERAARDVPRVSLVVSRDISETVNLHPVTKTLLCDRIAGALVAFEK